MMITTMQEQAQETIQTNIVKYSLMLCQALEDNFKSRNRGNVGGYAPPKYTFEINSIGRKYHKIMMHINGKCDSVHAFIDKKTGSVYKPASAKSPAKGERYNMLIIESRERMLQNCDWAGGYLYVK